VLKAKTKLQGTWIVALLGVAALVAVASSFTSAEADNVTTVRPIEDFLDQQVLAGGVVNWISEAKDGSWEYVIRPDFTGVINRDFVEAGGYGSANTTFTGKVTEQVQEDGRTLVHVSLRGQNVLCFAWRFQGPLVWGYPAGWLAHPNPAVRVTMDQLDTVSVYYDVKFLTPAAPGAPLPVLTQLMFNPTEGQEVLQQLINLHGTGELRAGFDPGVVADGATGQLTMTMKNVNNASFDPDPGADIKRDPWPVSRIDLRAVGQ
jgi:hypothetical protein